MKWRRETELLPGELFPEEEKSSHLRRREQTKPFLVWNTLLRFSMDKNMKYFILVETRRGHELKEK